ncbi:hypothetical protein FMM75_05960 [Lachnospiraceae bacterium MD335]|nr:hypothetical protein [Lachnospiraceae bacterium MD335]
MTIGGIGGNGGANAGFGTDAVSMNSRGTDAYSKSLQKQIMETQKQLQELSGNEEMTSEMKMKKRQELQKQISDLNMQLRQHQMEERRKAQQEKQEKQAQRKPQKDKDDGADGLSKGSMRAMISAEGSLKLAKQQGSKANEMQNGADIKRSEIKLDGGSSTRTAGDSAAVSSKWDDVEDMEQKAKAATASQMSFLAKAQDEVSKAAEAGTKADRTDKADERDNAKTQKTDDVSGETDENGEAAADILTKDVFETKAPVITMTQMQEDSAASAPALANQTAAVGSNVDVRI